MRAIDYFDKAAEEYSERTALLDRDIRYSYSQLRGATRVLAAAMRANGLNAEDRVAIYSLKDRKSVV